MNRYTAILFTATGITWFLLATAFAGEGQLSASDETNYSYPVVRGERPPIDLKNINDTAWAPGKMLIKLQPGADGLLPGYVIMNEEEYYLATGVDALDALNIDYKVKSYRQVMHTYYQTSRNAEKHRNRHIAWGFHLWYEVEYDTETDVREVVGSFMELPEVAFAEPVFRVEPILSVDTDILSSDFNDIDDHPGQLRPDGWLPDDPFFDFQWHYHNIGQNGGTPGSDISLPAAWEVETGHADVIVAVLDMGVQYDHPDLAANMWEGIGYNFVDDSPDIVPGSHGTHVAGTVAAVSNNETGVAGVAGGSGDTPGVRIMTCQVFSPGGISGALDLAFIYAADNGAAIAQNSWKYTQEGAYQQILLDAIDYFNVNGGGDVLNGGISIFGAGNDNSGGIYYPGYYSGTLAVAATNNNDIRPFYSNFGTWIDIAAPGGETHIVPEAGVLSTDVNNQYSYKMGTSMACPHVSGAAALLVSYGHRHLAGLSAADVHDLLISNTDEINHLNPNFENLLGAGRLNARNALKDLEGMLFGVANPGNLNASAVNTSQVQLSWIKNSNNDNVMLVWSHEPVFGRPEDGTAYSPGETIPGGGTVVYSGATSEFNHTGLTAGTHQYYKAFSYNESHTWSWGRTAVAFTPCEPAGIPFSESFTDGIVPPHCWVAIDKDGDGNNWRRGGSSFNPVAGDYVAYSSSQTGISLNPDNWLVSPPIHLESNNVILHYCVKANDPLAPSESYSVMVSSTSTSTDDFTEVYFEHVTSNQWKAKSLSINGFKDQDVYIAFRHWNSSGNSDLVLDSISIEAGMPGDVNPDNRVDVFDVVWMISHLAGDTPEGFVHDLGDLTGDGEITVADLVELINMIMSDE